MGVTKNPSHKIESIKEMEIESKKIGSTSLESSITRGT
jgi:hypothetical protein